MQKDEALEVIKQSFISHARWINNFWTMFEIVEKAQKLLMVVEKEVDLSNNPEIAKKINEFFKESTKEIRNLNCEK